MPREQCRQSSTRNRDYKLPPLELQHKSRDFASGIESVRFTIIRGSDLFMLVPTPSGSSPRVIFAITDGNFIS